MYARVSGLRWLLSAGPSEMTWQRCVAGVDGKCRRSPPASAGEEAEGSRPFFQSFCGFEHVQINKLKERTLKLSSHQVHIEKRRKRCIRNKPQVPLMWLVSGKW